MSIKDKQNEREKFQIDYYSGRTRKDDRLPSTKLQELAKELNIKVLPEKGTIDRMVQDGHKSPKQDKPERHREKDIIRVNVNIKQNNQGVGVGYELTAKEDVKAKKKIIVAGSIYRQERNLPEIFRKILTDVDENKKLVIIRHDKGVLTQKEVQELTKTLEREFPFNMMFSLSPSINNKLQGISKNANNALRFKSDKIIRNIN